MERLTKPFNGGYLFNMPHNLREQEKYIDKVSIKLGQYEDAEEQGLLLRLEYPNGWIPCEERLPVAETEVLILAKRKYRDGTFRYIVTNAMYEDGTVSEYDSAWRWENVDGEYDEENDCIIIPKGW